RGLRPDQHESVLYVWTSDADQKDPDFLTVIDASPTSSAYGTIIATVPTSAPANEAHHFGYTVNADRIFAGGLFSNRLFIYHGARRLHQLRLRQQRVALGGGKGRQARVHARAQAGRQRDPGGHADLLRQPLPVRVAVRWRCGAAVRYRRPVAPQAREHGALPS